MINGISTYLSHLRKDELILLLDFFEQSHSKNAKKEELLFQASDYLSKDPVGWLMQLPERDLLLLRKLSLCSDESWVDLDVPEYPCVLNALHLIVESEDSDGTCVALAPAAIMFVVRPFINDVIEDKERLGMFRIERIALGILNTYGVLTISDFVDAIFAMFNSNDREGMIGKIAHCPIVSMQKVFYKDEVYLVSPYVLDYENIIEERKHFRKVRKFATITVEDAISAGMGVPYCAFGAGTQALEDIRTDLEGLGYQEHEIEMLLTDIWINSQFSMEQACAESMFRCVNDKIDDIPTFGEYRRIIDAIASYANSTPKWLLKGRIPNDVDLLKLTIKIDEKSIEEAKEAWDAPNSEENGQPNPLEAYYKYNMAIRHVEPDAPCPCGSGLSYRNCHGKKLS